MAKLIIPPVFVLAAILLIAAIALFLPVGAMHGRLLKPIGILVALSGLLIFASAVSLFIKYKTSIKLGTPTYLIREGIYRKTRNPVYLGMCLFLLGLALCSQNIFSLFAPLGFFLFMHYWFIPIEEKMVKQSFGAEYQAYKQVTPKWIYFNIYTY